MAVIKILEKEHNSKEKQFSIHNKKQKEENKLIRTKIRFHNKIILFNYFIFLFIVSILSKGYYSYNNITLKFNKFGKAKIYEESNENTPDEVYIDGIKQNNTINNYRLNKNITIVKLVWNTTITSTSKMFRDCSDIIEIDLKNFDFSNVNDMSYMFKGCSSLSFLNLSNIDTSNIENMESAFNGCSSLKSLDLSYFDTSKVTDMISMFEGCSSLTSLDLNNFDTTKLSLMRSMFSSCSSLKSLNLSNFNTKSVIMMGNLFKGCSNLTLLNLENFDTSSVSIMSSMFMGCSSLISLNLSKFQSSEITHMVNMFYGCFNLSSLNNINNFVTNSVINMSFMFYNCSSLNSLDISNFKTEKVKNLNSLFEGCSSLTYLYLPTFETNTASNISSMFKDCFSLYSLNLGNFTMSTVTDISYMFHGCYKLTSLDLPGSQNFSSFTNMKKMFYGCKLLNVINLDKFITTKVRDMSYLFYGCTSLTTIKMNNFNTINVTDMSYMFYGCSNLTSFNLEQFNTINVINMSYMFSNCLSLPLLNLSSFDTKIVRKMDFMFSNCFSLSFLDLSSFDTSSVTDMTGMFYSCSNLTSLTISFYIKNEINNLNHNSSSIIRYLSLSNIFGFDTSKVENMSSMFYECSSLISLDLSGFDTSEVKDMSYMFSGCSSLESLNLQNFNITKDTIINNIFQSCLNLKYIDLSNSEFGDNLINMLPKEINLCKDEQIRISMDNDILSKIKADKCKDDKCSEEFPFQNLLTKECIHFCDINDLFKKTCILNYTEYEYPEDMIFKNIKEEIPNIELSTVGNISYLELKELHATFKLINTKLSQEFINNIKGLEDCDKILRSSYSIPTDVSLLLLMINIFNQNDNKYINKTIYDFYYPLNSKNFEKLDLTICKDLLKNDNPLECSDYSIQSLLLNDSCINCNEGFYTKYEDTNTNLTNFKKCYKDLEGYYMDKNLKAYKKCYSSCKACSIGGNDDTHNCQVCALDFPYTFPKNNYINCYNFCHYYNYNENNDTYQCQIEPKCFGENNKLIPGKNNSCIDDCSKDDKYKYEFRKICYEKCPDSESQISKNNNYFCDLKCPEERPFENIKNQQCIEKCELTDKFNNKCQLNYIDTNTKTIDLSKTIIENIKNGSMSEVLSKVTNSNESFVMKEGKDSHLISTLESNLKRVDFSSIDFGDCEKEIRSRNPIKDSEELILYEVEHEVEGFNIPIIEYVLFTEDGKTQLDLSVCDGMKIQYYIPVDIDEENMDKHNPSSDFYNDQCNKEFTEKGVDMTLYERKNQFNNNNMSLCEKGCAFIKFEPDTKKVECDCNVKQNMSFYNEDTDMNDLLEKIESEKSSSNLKVAQCANNALSSPKNYSPLILVLLLY